MPSATRVNYYVLIAGAVFFITFGAIALGIAPGDVIFVRGILITIMGLLSMGLGAALLFVAYRSDGHLSLR